MLLIIIFLLFILLLILQIVINKTDNKRYKLILSKMSNIIVLLYFLIFFMFILNGIFRYKEYRTSGYSYVVKDGKGKHTFNTDMYLIEDRLTGEIYIKLVNRYKNRFTFYSGKYLEDLILINNGDYIIDESNKIRLGNTYKYLMKDSNCSTLSWEKDGKQCSILIRYNEKKLIIISSYKNIDSQLKDLDYQYGFSFNKFKDFFDLSLEIEIDNKNKIVYFINNFK